MVPNSLLVFILGLTVGSFTSVVVEREGEIETDQKSSTGFFTRIFPWAFGRSRCDTCKKGLLWHDNIPLISYILLKARCRFCRSPVPFRYFVLELLMGFLFLWGYLNLVPLAISTIGQISLISPIVRGDSIFGFFPSYSYFSSLLLLFTVFVFLWSLVSIALVDLRFGLIPDGVLITSGFIIFGIRSLLVLQEDFFIGLGPLILVPLFWAIVAALFFIFLVWVTRGRGMGWGDVKLAFWMGLWLGWGVLVALWLAFLTGAITGIILILSRRKKWGQTLPFGPFLAWGTLVAVFAGNYLVSLILPRFIP